MVKNGYLMSEISSSPHISVPHQHFSVDKSVLSPQVVSCEVLVSVFSDLGILFSYFICERFYCTCLEPKESLQANKCFNCSPLRWCRAKSWSPCSPPWCRWWGSRPAPSPPMCWTCSTSARCVCFVMIDFSSFDKMLLHI